MRVAFFLLALALVGSCCGVAPPVDEHSDFGEAIMYEAVDLSEAHPAEQEEDAKTMEGLLHWAIAHSDPEELARRADETRHETLLADLTRQLEEKRARVRELKQYMDSQVTEAQLMKEAIAVLVRHNASAAERLRALQELQPLVEPIDNAHDLKPMGGIVPVVEHLFHSDAPPPAGLDPALVAAFSAEEVSGLRTAAAHVLGSAASNNMKFQLHLMEAYPDIFVRLIELSLDPDEEVCVKGLYALAAMSRNLQQGHAGFALAGGYAALEKIMGGGQQVGVRVKRKALSLIMDLAQLAKAPAEGEAPSAAPRLASHKGLLSSTLQLLGTRDLDTVEKALGAVHALLQGPDRAEAAKNLHAAGAGAVLKTLFGQLELDRAQGEDGDDSAYVDFLLQLCHKAQVLLEHLTSGSLAGEAQGEAGAEAGTEAGTGKGQEQGASPDGEGQRGRGARRRRGQAHGREEEGQKQPVLQLGHTEL